MSGPQASESRDADPRRDALVRDCISARRCGIVVPTGTATVTTGTKSPLGAYGHRRRFAMYALSVGENCCGSLKRVQRLREAVPSPTIEADIVACCLANVEPHSMADDEGNSVGLELTRVAHSGADRRERSRTTFSRPVMEWSWLCQV